MEKSHFDFKYNKNLQQEPFISFLWRQFIETTMFALVDDSKMEYVIHCYGRTFRIYIDKLRILLSQNHIVTRILNCPKSEVGYV